MQGARPLNRAAGSILCDRVHYSRALRRRLSDRIWRPLGHAPRIYTAKGLSHWRSPDENSARRYRPVSGNLFGDRVDRLAGSKSHSSVSSFSQAKVFADASIKREIGISRDRR
jgi:hypothetical protein